MFATQNAIADYASRLESESYPFYHRWYFRTGNVGDFEYLVRLLEPKPLDGRIGTRDMDVQDPGSNLQGITDPNLSGLLKLGGALRIPYESMREEDKEEFDLYNEWAISNFPHAFQSELAQFLNLPDDYSVADAVAVNLSLIHI